ncbi:hypothetical protein ABW20_dc0110318 [Dactylellina cionopaga]|nr:hypothetical protein ABW20_dc0110318 [Dactylellina cionopaga]
MSQSIHPPTLTVTYTHPTTSLSPHIISDKPLPPPPTPQISTSCSSHTHNDPAAGEKYDGDDKKGTHPPPEALHTEPSVSSKRAHLKSLRDAVKEAQAEINTFLTKRMEEEKTTADADAKKGAAKAAEDMERDGEMEEGMDEETKKLEEEVERIRREEEERKGKGKKRKKEKD